MTLTGVILNKAIIWDKSGEKISVVTFPRWADRFRFKGKSYIIDTKEASRFTINNYLWETDFYQYDKDNPFPLKIKTDIKPSYYNDNMGSELLDVILENKLAKDLGDLSKEKNKFSGLLNPTNILIGLGVIGFILYFIFRGSI